MCCMTVLEVLSLKIFNLLKKQVCSGNTAKTKNSVVEIFSAQQRAIVIANLPTLKKTMHTVEYIRLCTALRVRI